MLAGLSDAQWDDVTRVTMVLDRAATGELNTAKLRRLAEQRAPDPSIFEEREPWFFRTVASTYTIDSYFTRPDKATTLKNYETDLNEGRALLVGHDTRTLNLGASLLGKYEAHGYAVPDSEERVPWTYGDYFLLRGKEPQDSVIESFRGGVQNRFSVGFQPGWWRCSMDGMDLFSWDCPHIPGRYYDKDGKPVEDRAQGQLAFADLVDMHLRETSTVYANASPGATLLKAQRMVEAGEVHDWKTVRLLESLYRCRMPGSERTFPAAVPVQTEAEAEMPAEREGEQTEREPVCLHTDGLWVPTAELLAMGFERAVTVSELVRSYGEHRQAAAQIDKYRGRVIGEALEQGRRALGANFNEDRATRMFKGLDLDEIVEQRNDWQKAGDAIFAQGRQTEEQSDTPPATTEREADTRERRGYVSRLPAAASRVG